VRLPVRHNVDLVVAAKSLIVLRPLDLESGLRQLALEGRRHVGRRQFDVLQLLCELYLLDCIILPEFIDNLRIVIK